MSATLFRNLDEARGRFGPCALAIGNFDGVHAGHQALIRETADYARRNALRPSILTFDPHPTSVVAPERKPELVCTLEERIRLLFAYGAEHILVLPFTEDVARLTPREFVWQILVQALDSRAVLVGENFRFGHKQAGNAAILQAFGPEFGFVSQFLPAVVVRGEVVSSSAIRKHVSGGRVSRAARLLGRCFSVSGPVVSGHGIGSQQTVPTLNLNPVPGQILPRGVFTTETVDEVTGRRWPSITNVGLRPTFGGNELTIETYLLAPLDTPSPEHIQVQFRRFVREERQFPTADALRSQIQSDVASALTYWRRVAKFKQLLASIY